MRLDPLYRMVLDSPHGWSVALAGEGTESQHLFFAEGRCDGRVSGPMRGANHPRRRGDGTFCTAQASGIVPADIEHAARFNTDSAEIEFWFTQ